MLTSILVTDGGSHSAQKWAEATSTYIVDIAEGLSGEKLASSIKLQAAVIDILESAHLTVQDGERSRISTDASVINTELDASAHLSVNEVVAQIVAAGASTPWAAQMATPEFAQGVSDILYSHLHTNMHIERSWHADNNPDSPHAQAFRGANPSLSAGV